MSSADARALWAIRALDAWAELRGCGVTVIIDGKRYRCDVSVPGETRDCYGKTRESARHAAALAVFPSLPADVRAELGECP